MQRPAARQYMGRKSDLKVFIKSVLQNSGNNMEEEAERYGLYGQTLREGVVRMCGIIQWWNWGGWHLGGMWKSSSEKTSCALWKWSWWALIVMRSSESQLANSFIQARLLVVGLGYIWLGYWPRDSMEFLKQPRLLLEKKKKKLCSENWQHGPIAEDNPNITH